jgi:hypothetical protein
MKQMKFFVPLILFVASIFSCKKEDCPAPSPDLSGTTWKGSAVVNSATYNPFTLVFNTDGTATVTFQGFPPFSGSWSKTPNANAVNFFFDESATSKWKGTGTLNSTQNKLESGTLTRTAPSVITGTFTVDKQ